MDPFQQNSVSESQPIVEPRPTVQPAFIQPVAQTQLRPQRLSTKAIVMICVAAVLSFLILSSILLYVIGHTLFNDTPSTRSSSSLSGSDGLATSAPEQTETTVLADEGSAVSFENDILSTSCYTYTAPNSGVRTDTNWTKSKYKLEDRSKGCYSVIVPTEAYDSDQAYIIAQPLTSKGTLENAVKEQKSLLLAKSYASEEAVALTTASGYNAASFRYKSGEDYIRTMYIIQDDSPHISYSGNLLRYYAIYSVTPSKAPTLAVNLRTVVDTLKLK